MNPEERLGARVVGTVGSAAKKESLLKLMPHLRPEQVIVRGSAAQFASQLDDALRPFNQDRFDVVFDSLGGEFFQTGY